MHLRQPKYIYSACGPFYRIDLDKACFQHDMAYGKYKDLERRS